MPQDFALLQWASIDIPWAPHICQGAWAFGDAVFAGADHRRPRLSSTRRRGCSVDSAGMCRFPAIRRVPSQWSGCFKEIAATIRELALRASSRCLRYIAPAGRGMPTRRQRRFAPGAARGLALALRSLGCGGALAMCRSSLGRRNNMRHMQALEDGQTKAVPQEFCSASRTYSWQEIGRQGFEQLRDSRSAGLGPAVQTGAQVGKSGLWSHGLGPGRGPGPSSRPPDHHRPQAATCIPYR